MCVSGSNSRSIALCDWRGLCTLPVLTTGCYHGLAGCSTDLRTIFWMLMSCNLVVCDLCGSALPTRPRNYQVYSIWGKMNFHNWVAVFSLSSEFGRCRQEGVAELWNGHALRPTFEWPTVSTTPLEVWCLNSCSYLSSRPLTLSFVYL